MRPVWPAILFIASSLAMFAIFVLASGANGVPYGAVDTTNVIPAAVNLTLLAALYGCTKRTPRPT